MGIISKAKKKVKSAVKKSVSKTINTAKSISNVQKNAKDIVKKIGNTSVQIVNPVKKIDVVSSIDPDIIEIPILRGSSLGFRDNSRSQSNYKDLTKLKSAGEVRRVVVRSSTLEEVRSYCANMGITLTNRRVGSSSPYIYFVDFPQGVYFEDIRVYTLSIINDEHLFIPIDPTLGVSSIATNSTYTEVVGTCVGIFIEEVITLREDYNRYVKGVDHE